VRPPSPSPARPQPPEPLGTATRRASLRLLDAVLRRGEALEAALPAATRALHGGPDRGLAHAIAAETLRRLPDLDRLIDSATRLPLAPDAKARGALRIALAQVLGLGTPPHAAIATVLPLVDGGPRKLVHGVFGTLMRSEATLPPVPTLPAEAAARWGEAWGEAMLGAAAAAIAAPPPLDLSLADPAETDSWAQRLGGTSLLPGHVRLHDPAPVPELPGYADGGWWVQDVAAALPVRLLGPARGVALDLCAAPGGKTCQLAAAGWRVTAIDQSAPRLDRLRANLARTGLTAEVVQADILAWVPPAPADAVLIDAPCSATGIFRRHPDVLYRAHPRLIADMAGLQARILSRAADWVRPGGRLVYATCSLEPAEGEAQLDAFLAARPDYRLANPHEIAPGLSGPVIRTLPGRWAAEGGCDGFFMAALDRR